MPPTEATENAKPDTAAAASATAAPTTTTEAAGATGTEAAEAAAAEAKKVKVGDDEFDADERGNINIPVKAFESRLRRASKRALEEAFGTTDVASIKKKLARAAELESKQEEATRAQMSELERLRADLKAKDEKLTEASTQLETIRSEREFERTDSVVMTTATKYVDPKYAGVAAIQFGQYVRDELDDKEAKAMTTKDMAAWFEEYAKENPALAVKAPKAPKEEPAARREPLNNGAPERKPSPRPDAQGSKTAKLGQANSMTSEEWAAYKKQHGISY